MFRPGSFTSCFPTAPSTSSFSRYFSSPALPSVATATVASVAAAAAAVAVVAAAVAVAVTGTAD